MKTFLFACVHNAGRSQMAAALLNALVDGTEARALSAGTKPAERVHPEVVAVMRELGIDLSAVAPQRLTPELAAQAQLLITMGCGDCAGRVDGEYGLRTPVDYGPRTPIDYGLWTPDAVWTIP